MNVRIEISASNYLRRQKNSKKSRRMSLTSFDLIWPQLTSIDLRRTGWPVECTSTTWYHMSTFISLAKTAMFASYVPRNAFSGWHDPSYDVIGQMLGGSGSWNFQGGRKKDCRKAIEKMVTIERLTKKIFQENRRGVASTPLCRRGRSYVRSPCLGFINMLFAGFRLGRVKFVFNGRKISFIHTSISSLNLS